MKQSLRLHRQLKSQGWREAEAEAATDDCELPGMVSSSLRLQGWCQVEFEAIGMACS